MTPIPDSLRPLLERALEEMEADWHRIDEEFGPVEGGLDGAISRGEAGVIPELRALLSEQPQAKPACTTCEDAGTFPFDSPCPDCRPQPSAAQDAPDEMFEEGQWWLLELDSAVGNGTPEQKRAMAVVHNLLSHWQRAQSSPQPTAQVLEGWQLVPADPTPEMIAALGFNGDVDLAIGHAAISMDVANLYRAALSAAPAHPAPRNEQAGEWIACSERLPPVDVPVWLFVPGVESPFIGERSSGSDGWLWAEVRGVTMQADGSWSADDAYFDDFEPALWMPLPAPPALSQQADGGAA